MSCSATFHHAIQKYNVLNNPTRQTSLFFKRNPNLYKVALLTNHIFRAIAMTTFCTALPFGMPVNIALCFTASLFYRLTVETNCAYKFALPAFAGSLTFPMALEATGKIVEGLAFESLGACASAAISLAPLALYCTYIVLTVSFDVDRR